MVRSYITCDVFTDQAFGGNPLAVVLDAEGLSTAEMQRIAREFNYSETTFVCPPADPAHTANVRIFTPFHELPFAGHPNVGTSFVLAHLGNFNGGAIGDQVMFEEKAGLVPITITRAPDGSPRSTQFTAPAAFNLGVEIDPAEAAAMGGITAADIVTDRHPPQVAGVGMNVLIAEVKDRETLKNATPTSQPATAEKASPEVYFYVPRGDEPGAFDARMFAPDIGIAEDPATGAAAAAFTGLMAHLDGTDGLKSYRITQGEDMGRPSLILGEADVESGTPVRVRVGGSAVLMMRGDIDA